MVDRFSEQMPTNSFWKTKDLNHCSPFTRVTRMTHVFLEVSVLYKAVLLQVGLPRLHGVDGALGVGDDAAHVVRLVVRAGVVRPSRVRLQEQLDSIRGLCVQCPLPHFLRSAMQCKTLTNFFLLNRFDRFLRSSRRCPPRLE